MSIPYTYPPPALTSGPAGTALPVQQPVMMPTRDTDEGVLARLVIGMPSSETLRRYSRNKAWIQQTLGDAVEAARVEAVSRGGALSQEVVEIANRVMLLSHGPDPRAPGTYAEQITEMWQQAAHLLAMRVLGG